MCYLTPSPELALSMAVCAAYTVNGMVLVPRAARKRDQTAYSASNGYDSLGKLALKTSTQAKDRVMQKRSKNTVIIT